MEKIRTVTVDQADANDPHDDLDVGSPDLWDLVLAAVRWETRHKARISGKLSIFTRRLK